jgi:hypothetical protein
MGYRVVQTLICLLRWLFYSPVDMMGPCHEPAARGGAHPRKNDTMFAPAGGALRGGRERLRRALPGDAPPVGIVLHDPGPSRWARCR